MPTTRRTRTLSAEPDAVWKVVADPHHFPRWWPRVRRMEAVSPERWTKVYLTAKGHTVRGDFRLLESDPARRLTWEQELEDSPFERLMNSAVTAVELEPAGGDTRVTIELRQRLRGMGRLGGFLVRRANRKVLDEALDGLEQACVR
jgi:uncharacterized protein YndB with AHSA1/START domain